MNPIDRHRGGGPQEGPAPAQPRATPCASTCGSRRRTVKEEIKGKPKETERERVQVFEGIVIGLRGTGARATMTVRKVSFGQGVERIFPLHARTIEKIEVVKQARVRRAKLYYLRERKGKAGAHEGEARGSAGPEA